LVKVLGARFKRFMDLLGPDKELPVSVTPKNRLTLNEPSVSSPSVSRVQLNVLKRTIESKNDRDFDFLVGSNLRYLINTSGDTPTIVVEGFRYNALHIAAKVGNFHVVETIFRIITDSSALQNLYGTNEADVKMRSDFLLDAYLNTPDRGANETPLHVASKFGHINIVKFLLGFEKCDKNLKNRNGEKAIDICCARYDGEKKETITDGIKQLFFDLYVSLYRAVDDHLDVIILPSVNSTTNCQLPILLGPFVDAKTAQDFREAWAREEKKFRISDPFKGTERIGRVLAKRFCVRWMEHWKFTDGLVDLQSAEGLKMLNDYLQRARYTEKESGKIKSVTRPIRMFNDDIFEQNRTISRLANLHINEGITSEILVKERESDGSILLSPNESRQELSNEHECFYTPPSSPPPVYILDDFPSKEDDELHLVNLALIDKFWAVKEYIRAIQKIPAEERDHWPMADSPRARKRRHL
uniref:ANK_REP_REGION domain-containing protein n=1 Tax=Dracunculus medinensis TaxID=318479 RepID=A0A0N4U578_DRAME